MTTPLRFIIEGEDESGRAFGRVERSLDKTEKKSKNLLAAWRDITVVGAGVIRVARGIASGFDETLDAAKAQVDAEIKLAVALSKNTKNVRENLDALKGFASAKQSVTEFGDEMILNLATVGAEFGVQGQLLQDILDATIDRSIALQRSPVEVMKVFAKFAGGVTDSLQDVGFRMGETETRAELLERAVRESATGMAEAIGSLPTAKIVQLRNLLGDLREGFGKVIVSTGTFQTIVGFIEDKVSRLNAAIEDPKKLREIVETIDGFVKDSLRFIAAFVDGILMVVESILRGMESIAKVANDAASIFGKDLDSRLRQHQKRWQDLQRQLDETIITLVETGAAQGELQEKTAGLRREVEQAKNAYLALENVAQLDFGADKINEARVEVGSFFREIIDGISDAETVPEAFDRVLSQIMNKIQGRTEEAKDGEVSLAGAELGRAYIGSFQNAAVGLFDEDVSIRESFRNLGTDVKNVFIGQMTESAFSPIVGVFGNLADSIGKQFNFVGKIIAAVINPVVTIVGSVVNTVIGFLFELIGVQALASALGVKTAAASTAVASVTAAAWGPAAVAAAIATLGGALAFGPIAITQMVAGSATAKALSLGGAAGLEEGGLVRSRPGGTLAILGEGNEDELVTPLSKVGQVFGGGLSITINMEGANLNVASEGEAENSARLFAEELTVALEEHRNLERLRGFV